MVAIKFNHIDIPEMDYDLVLALYYTCTLTMQVGLLTEEEKIDITIDCATLAKKMRKTKSRAIEERR